MDEALVFTVIVEAAKRVSRRVGACMCQTMTQLYQSLDEDMEPAAAPTQTNRGSFKLTRIVRVGLVTGGGCARGRRVRHYGSTRRPGSSVA